MQIRIGLKNILKSLSSITICQFFIRICLWHIWNSKYFGLWTFLSRGKFLQNPINYLCKVAWVKWGVWFEIDFKPDPHLSLTVSKSFKCFLTTCWTLCNCSYCSNLNGATLKLLNWSIINNLMRKFFIVQKT